MSNINVLDCTLRDGGYINNWNFGKDNIENILFNLSKSNIEIIECGFLSSIVTDENSSLYNSIESVSNLISTSEHNCPLYVAMIAIGEKEIDPRLISDRSKGLIGGIRLTFHQSEINQAFDYAKIIIEKGYKLFMQPVGTTNYTDRQLVELLEKINELNPYAFYIVDTLGIMYTKDLFRQVFLVDNNLNKSIKLGFHSHNNFQMSFANAQALAEYKTDREIIVDCSANGMGRGAGNLCSELFLQFLNKNYNKKYDVLPILEIVDRYLTPIYYSSPWGYNSAYFLSATNSCHPNYASFLISKHTLSMTSIGSILTQIPQENKRFFDKELIENLYIKYQSKAVDDSEIITKLRKKFSDREILVIAPGLNVKKHKEKIEKYIKKNNPIVIAVNFIPSSIKYDYIFVGNNLRYEQLKNKINNKKVIFTSNIDLLPKKAIVVNYSELINSSLDASDSSGIMILKLLMKASVQNISLAGYDGFSLNPLEHYIDKSLCATCEPILIKSKNLAIKEQLHKISHIVKIKYITPSIFKEKNKNKRVKEI